MIETIVLKLTTNCFRNCIFCHEKKSNAILTIKDLKKSLYIIEKELSIDKKVLFILHGGEPYLVKDTIPEIVNIIRNKYPESNIGIQTSVFSEEWFDSLIKHNICISLSIDGISDRMNSIEYSNAIKYISKNISMISVITSLHSTNRVQIVNTINDLSSNNIKYKLNIISGKYSPSLSVIKSVIDYTFKTRFDLEENNSDIYGFVNSDIVSRCCSNRFCGLGTRVIAIYPNMQYSLCGRSETKYKLKHKLKDNIRKEKSRQYELIMSNDKCYNCKYRIGCTNGCSGFISKYGSTYFDLECETYKYRYDKIFNRSYN